MRKIEIDLIIEAVCYCSHLSESELFSRDRKIKIVWPRQMFFYLGRRYSDLTLSQLGRISMEFGRDPFHHTTIIHSNKCVNDLLDVDDSYMVKLYNECLERIDFMELNQGSKAIWDIAYRRKIKFLGAEVNGTMVYEGDLLESKGEDDEGKEFINQVPVVFDNGAFWADISFNKDGSALELLCEWDEPIKIVGNIYEKTL